ncbi:MAG TPA: hypothetical protein VJN95_08600 [Gemmatimonadales bacterium]|nr:hypothetical protein [Gemmatimonadales bacterium]
MRVRAGDPEAARVEAVSLDGWLLENVVEADDQEGWAEREVLVDGRPVIENGQVKTARVHGAITIHLRPCLPGEAR